MYTDGRTLPTTGYLISFTAWQGWDGLGKVDNMAGHMELYSPDCVVIAGGTGEWMGFGDI